MYENVFFENIRVEMARRCLSLKDISEATCMNRNTLGAKFSGKKKLYLDEAVRIQQSCFPDCEIDYLFKEVLETKKAGA